MSDEPLARDMQHPFATSPDAYGKIRRGDHEIRELERLRGMHKGADGVTVKGDLTGIDPNQFPPGTSNYLFPVICTVCVNGAPGFGTVAFTVPPQPV